MLTNEALKIEVEIKKRIQELYGKRKNLAADKIACMEAYQVANTGDRSENAPLEAAIERMKEINSAILTNENQIKQLEKIEDLSKYNSVGIVVLYSTVKLRCNDGTKYVYRIFPKDVSFIDINVIAENSRMAIAIMGKQVGDVVHLEHTSKNSVLSYTIEEIY